MGCTGMGLTNTPFFITSYALVKHVFDQISTVNVNFVCDHFTNGPLVWEVAFFIINRRHSNCVKEVSVEEVRHNLKNGRRKQYHIFYSIRELLCPPGSQTEGLSWLNLLSKTWNLYTPNICGFSAAPSRRYQLGRSKSSKEKV